MATETITIRYCDMPHDQRADALDTQFRILWQGQLRTLDLCEEHADEYARALQPFLDAASAPEPEDVGGRSTYAARAGRRPAGGGSSGGGTRQSNQLVTAAELSAEEREWATKNGWKGKRLPLELQQRILDRRNESS